MGTREFVGFVAEGREVIAYNHSDSYPDWLGVNTLKWLGTANLDTAKQAAPKVKLVSASSQPTDEEIKALAPSYNPNVDQSGSELTGKPTWYQLLRETQGDLGAMLRVGYVEDASIFPFDSLFCEWGYLVNFDAGRFEVYRGFQHDAHTEGRFARPEPHPDAHGYFPVRLVASWPLDELPHENAFMDAIAASNEKDEG